MLDFPRPALDGWVDCCARACLVVRPPERFAIIKGLPHLRDCNLRTCESPTPPVTSPVTPPVTGGPVKTKRKGHGRKPLPENLPHERIEIDLSEFMRSCPPGYFNNEGEEKPKWALFRGYGHG